MIFSRDRWLNIMRYRFSLCVRLVCIAFAFLFTAVWSAVAHAQHLYWTRNIAIGPNVMRASYDGTVEGLFRTGTSPGIAIHDDFLFLSSRQSGTSSIFRSTLDGAESTRLFSSTSDIRGLGFDPVGDRLYFHDNSAQRFLSFDEDGGNINQGVSTGSSEWVESLAVDGVNRMLYWTQLDSLWRAPLNGGPKELLAGPNAELELTVHSVALDLQRGHMYWTEWHDDEESPFLFGGRVRRANLDGTNVQTIITGLPREDDLEGYHSGLFNSNYLAIDPTANQLFTFNESVAAISRANLDGSELNEWFIDGPMGSVRGMTVNPAVPEPSTFILVASGIALAISRRSVQNARSR
jgi:hypothetical protein